MRRHLITSLIIGLCAGVTPAVVGPAPASAADQPVRTDQKCRPKKYDNHYRVVTKDKKPVVTHLRAFAMPPSSSHKVTKTVSKQTRLRARVSYDMQSEIGVSGAAKVIAKASASTHLSLQSSGSRTVKTKVKVTDRISNPTKKNAQFVFFRGNMTAKGAFRYYYCSMYYTPTGNVGYFVYYKTGKWRSFAVYSDGAARCGAGGAVNAVTRAALAQGC